MSPAHLQLASLLPSALHTAVLVISTACQHSAPRPHAPMLCCPPPHHITLPPPLSPLQVPALLARHPDLISLEMETFQLLDLARSSHGSLRAMGFCIALAERYTNTFMEPQVGRWWWWWWWC